MPLSLGLGYFHGAQGSFVVVTWGLLARDLYFFERSSLLPSSQAQGLTFELDPEVVVSLLVVPNVKLGVGLRRLAGGLEDWNLLRDRWDRGDHVDSHRRHQCFCKHREVICGSVDGLTS